MYCIIPLLLGFVAGRSCGFGGYGGYGYGGYGGYGRGGYDRKCCRF